MNLLHCFFEPSRHKTDPVGEDGSSEESIGKRSDSPLPVVMTIAPAAAKSCQNLLVSPIADDVLHPLAMVLPCFLLRRRSRELIFHQTPPGKRGGMGHHGHTGISVGDSWWHTQITNEEVFDVVALKPFVDDRVPAIHAGTARSALVGGSHRRRLGRLLST